MADYVEYLKIDLKHAAGRVEMLENVHAALRIIGHAIAVGSWGSTYTYEQFCKLDQAKKLLGEVHDELIIRINKDRSDSIPASKADQNGEG